MDSVMSLRQRHHKIQSSGETVDHDQGVGGNTRAHQVDKGFTKIILYALALIAPILVLTATYPAKFHTVFDKLGFSVMRHAVVIDAGSTGSRVLAFTFTRGLLDGTLNLVDELWHEVTPGLSSYAADPSKAAESIVELLEVAKRRFPEQYWNDTPITLKATAGLRLLPKDQAESILKEVEKVLRMFSFRPDDNLIEIMNPRDEGLFVWFTANFHLGFLSSDHSLKNSFAALDLGGGSTQITFFPRNHPVSGLEDRKYFMHQVAVMGTKKALYSHSYLGLGLMAAREAIFTAAISPGETGDSVIRSECVASDTAHSWTFNGKTYVVSSDGASSYERCLAAAQRVIKANDVHLPDELNLHKVAAFSFFFDRALDSQILPAGSTEGLVKVGSYVDAARQACSPGAQSLNGFMCVDLTFISSLLLDGYGLSADKELSLYKLINGYEASWAFGVAYNLLN